MMQYAIMGPCQHCKRRTLQHEKDGCLHCNECNNPILIELGRRLGKSRATLMQLDPVGMNQLTAIDVEHNYVEQENDQDKPSGCESSPTRIAKDSIHKPKHLVCKD